MKIRTGFLAKSLILIFSASILFYISVVSSTSFKRDLEASLSDSTSSNGVLTIAVYYETKCSDSAEFILHQVSNVLNMFPHVVNFVLIPYGNANYTYNETSKLWNFKCQHGPDECFGNMIHNCLIFLRPNFKDHFPFINCSMSHHNDQSTDVAIECNHSFPIPYNAVMDCAQGQMGNSLLYTSALLTDRLIPHKNYVPWIVIDGVHTDDIQDLAEDNLVKLVCHLYKGRENLESCSAFE